MRIDKKLNLVVPVEMDDGSKLFVHSTPISSDVYTTYWKPLSRAFADIHTQGLAAVGARVAANVLQDVSMQLRLWDGPTGVERGLIPEIHRLTNVMVIGARGWESMPFDDARSKKMLDDEILAEIEGMLIFFTAASHLYRRGTRQEMLMGALAHWDAQIESSNCMELLHSLQTSTAAENTGAKAA
jgi:hypothetical protein